MTENTKTDADSGIARRTALSLAGGAIASLAGCFGGGSSGSPEGPPEERSELIQSTEITAQDNGPRYPQINLDIEMVEAGWSSVALLTEAGDNFYTTDFTENETITSIPLLSDSGTIGPAPAGEHTLIFERENGDEHRVAFILSGSMGFVEALSHESSELSGGDDFGLVFRNTSDIPDAIDLAATEEINDSIGQISSGVTSEGAILIPEDETDIAPFTNVLVDTSSACEESGLQDEEFTVDFLWSDPITVSVPIEYSEGGYTCTGEIAGTAQEVTAEQQGEQV